MIMTLAITSAATIPVATAIPTPIPFAAVDDIKPALPLIRNMP